MAVGSIARAGDGADRIEGVEGLFTASRIEDGVDAHGVAEEGGDGGKALGDGVGRAG